MHGVRKKAVGCSMEGLQGHRVQPLVFPYFVAFSVMNDRTFQHFCCFSFLSLVNAWPQYLYCVLLLLHKGSFWLCLKEDGFLDTAGIAAVEELYLQKKTDCKY